MFLVGYTMFNSYSITEFYNGIFYDNVSVLKKLFGKMMASTNSLAEFIKRNLLTLWVKLL